MKQSSPRESKKVIVLPPPVFTLSTLSNRYDLVIDLRWGKFEHQIKVNLEYGILNGKLLEALNKALLEGSESEPYILK